MIVMIVSLRQVTSLSVYCCPVSYSMLFFFFQAEDGIRDATVTGVQTCALPISTTSRFIARVRLLRMKEYLDLRQAYSIENRPCGEPPTCFRRRAVAIEAAPRP